MELDLIIQNKGRKLENNLIMGRRLLDYLTMVDSVVLVMMKLMLILVLSHERIILWRAFGLCLVILCIIILYSLIMISWFEMHSEVMQTIKVFVHLIRISPNLSHRTINLIHKCISVINLIYFLFSSYILWIVDSSFLEIQEVFKISIELITEKVAPLKYKNKDRSIYLN